MNENNRGQSAVRKRQLLRGLSVFLLGAMAAQAQAMDMGSGTLTVSEQELEFGRGPNIGVNPPPLCEDPVLPCDTYALSSDLPDDLVSFFPGATIEISLSWDSVSGADDYDLHLFDANDQQIGSSTSFGGPEFIGVLASPGQTDYRIEVIHYAVAGTTYQTEILLDLGEPAADKSDEEVAAWLADHGGLASRDAELAESCESPGLKILADASGDSATMALGHDLEELHVYQTENAAGELVVVFDLKVEDLSQLTPQTSYFVSFQSDYGDVRGVRMDVDELLNVSFYSYQVSEDSDGDRLGQFVVANSQVTADPMSQYSADGLISIAAKPKDLALLLPNDRLSGFNAGIIVFIGAEGIGGALTDDSMPDGLSRRGEFEYLSAEQCRGEEPEAQAASRGLGASKGGALSLWVLIGLLGLVRRRA